MAYLVNDRNEPDVPRPRGPSVPVATAGGADDLPNLPDGGVAPGLLLPNAGHASSHAILPWQSAC